MGENKLVSYLKIKKHLLSRNCKSQGRSGTQRTESFCPASTLGGWDPTSLSQDGKMWI